MPFIGPIFNQVLKKDIILFITGLDYQLPQFAKLWLNKRKYWFNYKLTIFTIYFKKKGWLLKTQIQLLKSSRSETKGTDIEMNRFIIKFGHLDCIWLLFHNILS